MAYYFEAFEAKRRSKPVGFGGAEGRAISKLIDACKGDTETACKVISGAFASWKGDTVTIRQIASNPSEFVGAQSAKGMNGRGTPKQPNYGYQYNIEVIEND